MNPKSGMKRWGLLLAVVTNLLMLACTTITVMNKSDKEVRVVIRPPDAKSIRVSVIKPGALKLVNAKSGGFFYITVLADRALIDEMTRMKAYLTTELSKPDLSPDVVQQIQKDIQTLNQKIKQEEDKASKDIRMCSGTLVDYGSVDAEITTKADGKFRLDCTIQKPQPISFPGPDN